MRISPSFRAWVSTESLANTIREGDRDTHQDRGGGYGGESTSECLVEIEMAEPPVAWEGRGKSQAQHRRDAWWKAVTTGLDFPSCGSDRTRIPGLQIEVGFLLQR